MQTKTRILEAATRVVARDGSNKLTLEAVALEADISKGGLLYHFPSKHALLEGMVAAMLQRIQASITEQSAKPQYHSNFTGAYLQSQLQGREEDSDQVLALLAAAAQDPTLLGSVRELNTRWLQQSDQQGDLATVLLLAAQGVRLMDHLQILPQGQPSAKHYFELLARLADEL